jgi:hypothetical protein
VCYFNYQLKNESDLLLNKYRDQTPPSTPQRVQEAARQNERDQRVLDSPEQRRIPQDPPPIPRFTHLPANLAQQLAELPPLRQRGRRRQAPDSIVPAPVPAPAFALAPAFTPAPAPAPYHYEHLPDHLAQQLAALPSFPQRGRIRRGYSRNIPVLPHVCFFIFIFI